MAAVNARDGNMGGISMCRFGDACGEIWRGCFYVRIRERSDKTAHGRIGDAPIKDRQNDRVSLEAERRRVRMDAI